MNTATLDRRTIDVQSQDHGGRSFDLIKSRAHSRSALRTATAKGRPVADRQLAGAAMACVSCRGNAKQLGDLDTTALRTVGQVTAARIKVSKVWSQGSQ